MTKIKLAIAEDNKKARKAIIKFIRLEKDLEVVLEAENGLQLLELLKTTVPDIILMDIRMPVMNGVEATDRIKELYPNLKVIAYSQYDLEENIIEMYVHGVKSFIGKEDEPDELFKAIRIVYDSGIYMTDKAASIVQHYLTKQAPISAPKILSDFDQFLIKGICNGLSSTELGRLLNRSPRTIEEYRTKLYQKLGVKNKEHFIIKAIKLNLV